MDFKRVFIFFIFLKKKANYWPLMFLLLVWKDLQTARNRAQRQACQSVSGPTCAALDGSDGGGRCARRGGRQQQQGSPSLPLLLPRAALVDGPHVAVAAHPEAAWHGQRVHGLQAVHGRLHGLGLQLAVHLLTHLLDLTVHLQLTQLPVGSSSSGGGGTERFEVDRVKKRLFHLSI